MINRLIKIAGWCILWLLFFWGFLISGFPHDTAKEWVAERLRKEISAKVSIEELRIKWNLDVKVKGISINGGQTPPNPLFSKEHHSGYKGVPKAGELVVESGLSPNYGGEGFILNLTSLDIKPKLLSLIRLKPALDFNASTPSGGDLSGSYNPAELSISFKDISFKDITISTLPVPSGTTAAGFGIFKLIKGKGTVEVEVEGVPGGKQKLTAPGGESPGLDGKLKVTVSLPKL